MIPYPQVQVRWFYHPAEVEGTAEGGGRVQDLEVTNNALFSSSHEDQNDVQTISHRCSLLELEVRSLLDCHQAQAKVHSGPISIVLSLTQKSYDLSLHY